MVDAKSYRKSLSNSLPLYADPSEKTRKRSGGEPAAKGKGDPKKLKTKKTTKAMKSSSKGSQKPAPKSVPKGSQKPSSKGPSKNPPKGSKPSKNERAQGAKKPPKTNPSKTSKSFNSSNAPKPPKGGQGPKGSNGKKKPPKNLGKAYPSSIDGGKPKKRLGKGAKIAIAVVLLLAIGCGIDVLLTKDKIHAGVHVGTVDVGGMTVDEAKAAISETYQPMIDSADIYMYESEEAMEAQEKPTKIAFDYETMLSFEKNPLEGPAFVISPATLGATIDSEALAQEAYAVGRGWDFFFGRVRGYTFGVEIDPVVTLDQGSFTALSEMLTGALGNAMVNPDIAFSEGTFTTTEGNDGYMVVDDKLMESLQKMMLAEGDRAFVVPMQNVKMQVDLRDAQKAADKAQAAITEPITLEYNDQSWEVGPEVLGSWVATYVEEGTFSDSLVPYISVPLAQEGIESLKGIGSIGTPAQNVKFSYDGKELTWVDAQTGIGPNYYEIASRLNTILFNDGELATNAGEIPEPPSEFADEMAEEEAEEANSETETEAASEGEEAADGEAAEGEAEEAEPEADSRTVVINVTTSYPKLTYEDAEKLQVTGHLISKHRTTYKWASKEKVHNIHLISDMLTNSLIAPGETWSVNDITGACNASKGFKEGGSIIGGKIVSEVGGGICQVATTIYDAVFYAGYPIVERHNHSTYVASYDDGMDAALSYPYLDFKFKNNTNNYILLLVDYDDTSVTCSLWGIDPEYVVKTEQIRWDKGEEYKTEVVANEYFSSGKVEVNTYGVNGHIIGIMRYVYDAKGNLVDKDYFESNYEPKTQIIECAPDVLEQTKKKYEDEDKKS